MPDATTSDFKNCSVTGEGNNNTCFTRIVGQDIERGCFSELFDREAKTKCMNNDESCLLCQKEGGKCNTEIFPKRRLYCHSCQDHINSTCGHPKNEKPVVCKKYDENDECVAYVTGDMVYRGCKIDEPYCDTEGACRVCKGNGCNNRHYNSATENVLSLSVLAFTASLLLLLK